MRKPFQPFDYGGKDVQGRPGLAKATAIQALAEGRANEWQQQLALRAIVEDLCGTYDLSYQPDSDRDTAFAEGKRFVGLQIVKLTSINLRELVKDDE